jgi:hypothetical protein
MALAFAVYDRFSSQTAGDATLNLIECKWPEKRINTACAILCTFTTLPMLTFCFSTYFLKVIFIDYWQWIFT